MLRGLPSPAADGALPAKEARRILENPYLLDSE